MAKYINLDKLNDILRDDKREAFSKHQVWLLLNYHPELVIEIGIDIGETQPHKPNGKDCLLYKNSFSECNEKDLGNDILHCVKNDEVVDVNGYCKNFVR